MGKISIEIETEYEKGDIVVFKKDSKLLVGRIEGYYVDATANNSLWFNIRVNKNLVYSYSNGDIAEWDIISKIDDENINNYFNTL